MQKSYQRNLYVISKQVYHVSPYILQNYNRQSITLSIACPKSISTICTLHFTQITKKHTWTHELTHKKNGR